MKYGSLIALVVALVAFALVNSVTMMASDALGWAHLSPWYHNMTDPNSTRFDAEPSGFESQYYYWQTPALLKSALTRTLPWIFYVLHQTSSWVVIYLSTQKSGSLYKPGLRWFNWAGLLVNGLFHVVHIIQSVTSYDALAFDVPEASSQGSVILMLVLILLLEFRERGIAFGWPGSERRHRWARKCNLSQMPITLVRKYHGYVFAWAVIWTMWYHPRESTAGHLLGFMHTSMIMIQGSLVFTDAHLNKYWRLANEVMVLIHSTVVAVQTENPAKPFSLWPRFCLGFALILVVTQIFSLPFWAKIHLAFRVVPLVIFLAAWGAIYGALIQDFSMSWEAVQIPLIEYAFAGGIFLILWFGAFLVHKCCGDSKKKTDTVPIIVAAITLSAVTIINWAFHRGDPPISYRIDLIALMVILVLIDAIFFCIMFLVWAALRKYPVFRTLSEDGSASDTSKAKEADDNELIVTL